MPPMSVGLLLSRSCPHEAEALPLSRFYFETARNPAVGVCSQEHCRGSETARKIAPDDRAWRRIRTKRGLTCSIFSCGQTSTWSAHNDRARQSVSRSRSGLRTPRLNAMQPGCQQLVRPRHPRKERSHECHGTFLALPSSADSRVPRRTVEALILVFRSRQRAHRRGPLVRRGLHLVARGQRPGPSGVGRSAYRPIRILRSGGQSSGRGS